MLLPIYAAFLGLPRSHVLTWATLGYTLLVAGLMVSRLPVFSGKRIGTRVPPDLVAPVVSVLVLFVALLIAYPWIILDLGDAGLPGKPAIRLAVLSRLRTTLARRQNGTGGCNGHGCGGTSPLPTGAGAHRRARKNVRRASIEPHGVCDLAAGGTMRLGRRAFLTSLAASVMAPAVLRLARADAPQVTLKLHHFFSSVSSGHEKFLVPWARRVAAQSAGRIRIDIFPSMQLGGAPAQLFDQGRDGFADIVWAVPGYTPGRFGRIEAFELPFLPSRRALVNSKALEDFAAANLRDEFREVHPICFSCRDHSVVHTNRAVRAVSDLRGLRLHVPNRLAAESVHALGASGVTVPVPQVPMAVSGHAIEGCLMPWDAVPALRLNDLLKQHTDFAESALSTSTFVLAMNKPAYDRLPADLKTVIDENSGLEAAGMAGAMWDVGSENGRRHGSRARRSDYRVAGGRGRNWRAATRPVVSLWLKQMKERKIDGGKLLANIHALIGKYASEPEPETPRPASSNRRNRPSSASPKPAQPSQAPQATAEIARPKADAPAAASPPAAKRVPPKELDIPLCRSIQGPEIPAALMRGRIARLSA